MSTFSVNVIADAEEDLFDIYRYIASNDSHTNAEYVFNNIVQVCESLLELPERGHIVPELERVGVMEYRQLHFKPYRIIYRIDNKQVFVYAILDGRRDIKDLLEMRVLR